MGQSLTVSTDMTPNPDFVQMQAQSQQLLSQAQGAIAQENTIAVLTLLQKWRLMLGDYGRQPLQKLPEPHQADWLAIILWLLQQGDFQSRWDAAKFLPDFGTAAIVPLLELLDDETGDPDSQWFIVRVLVEYQHPAIVPTLLRLLQTSPSEELQAAAVDALSQMGPKVLMELPPLLDRPETRRLGVMILAQIRHSETVPMLLPLAQDAQPEVRAIALEALSSFHQRAIAEVLHQGLQDPATKVRLTAVRGVGFCWQDAPTIDWVKALQPLLYDLDVQVGGQAALALGKLGSEAAIAALLAPLDSPHTPSLLAAEIFRALVWTESPQALTAIQNGWDNWPLDLTARSALSAALGQLEKPENRHAASEILLIWLQNAVNQPDSVQEAEVNFNQFLSVVIYAIGQLGQPEAIAPLVQLLGYPATGLRLHLIAALKRIDATQAHVQLQQLSLSSGSHPLMSDELAAGIQIALQEW
jgi:HEAT repeat protein